MPKFFALEDEIANGEILLSQADSTHALRVLRMREGDELTVCDGAGSDFFCTVKSAENGRLRCNIKSKCLCKSEPNIDVTLYMALPKSDKFEFIIEKATELGVTRIVPVLTARCVRAPTAAAFAAKLPRYAAHALAAAKQSGRGIVPQVMGLIDFKTACARMAEDDAAFVLYEKAGNSAVFTGLKGAKTVSFIVGSEGGFEKSEVDMLQQNGVCSVGLGARILRCETAPITFLSILMYETENF